MGEGGEFVVLEMINRKGGRDAVHRDVHPAGGRQLQTSLTLEKGRPWNSRYATDTSLTGTERKTSSKRTHPAPGFNAEESVVQSDSLQGGGPLRAG